jgi:hypothetical protein
MWPSLFLGVPDSPPELLGLSGGVPNRPRLHVGPLAVRRIGAYTWPPSCACPTMLEVVMVIFRVPLHLGYFFAITFLQETFMFSSASRVLSMMTTFFS